MLDPAQDARIAAIETRFAARRRMLEQAMRADNARLADAIAAEQSDGPRVAAAVDACHRTMDALQKVTLAMSSRCDRNCAPIRPKRSTGRW